MNTNRDPLRLVRKVQFHQMPYTRIGQGQNVLLLACGHSNSRKTSVPIPNKARCYECGRGANQ